MKPVHAKDEMKLSRPSRVVAACLALIGMLFMQLAVASYICPGMANGNDAPMAASTSMPPGMPGCDRMDKAQPSLCHASAHSQDQSLDTPQLPAIHPFIAVHVVQLAALPVLISFSDTSSAPSSLLKRSTAPPIAIRHCCFRI